MKSFPVSTGEYKNEITNEIELPNVRSPSEMSETFHKSEKQNPVEDTGTSGIEQW